MCIGRDKGVVGVFVDRETQHRSLCVFVERLENVIMYVPMQRQICVWRDLGMFEYRDVPMSLWSERWGCGGRERVLVCAALCMYGELGMWVFRVS